MLLVDTVMKPDLERPDHTPIALQRCS
jgi:hypothetical protein